MSFALTPQQFDVEKTVSVFVTNIKAGIETYVKTNMEKMTLDIAKRFFLFYYYFDDLAYKLTKQKKLSDSNSKLVNIFTELFTKSTIIDKNTLLNSCNSFITYYDKNKESIKNCIEKCIADALDESQKSITKCFNNEEEFNAIIQIVRDVLEKIPKLELYVLINSLQSYDNLDDTNKSIITLNQFKKIKTTLDVQTPIFTRLENLHKDLIVYESKFGNADLIYGNYINLSNNSDCTLLKSAYKYKQQIIDLQEDIEGLVRVYIKIRPIVYNDNDNENQSDIKIENDFEIKTRCTIIQPGSITMVKDTVFGPFYGIYQKTNINLLVGDTDKLNTKIDEANMGTKETTDFSPFINEKNKESLNGLFKSFDQAATGYSIVIFGYGLSGSGKTYTLLGEIEQDTQVYHQGVIIHGLEYLSQQGCSIEIAHIFEQYNDELFRNINVYQTKVDEIKAKIETLNTQLKSENKYYSSQPFDANGNAKKMTPFQTKTFNITQTKIQKIENTIENLKKQLKHFQAKNEKQDKLQVPKILKYNSQSEVFQTNKNKPLSINMLFCKIFQYYCIDELKNTFTKSSLSLSDYIEIEEVNLENQDYNLYDDNSQFSKNKLIKILININEYRKAQERIKQTPNNPTSSRSHLYIVFKITNKLQNVGYITIVDMGGRENGFEIIKKYYANTSKFTFSKFFSGEEEADVNTQIDTALSTQINNLENKIRRTQDQTYKSVLTKEKKYFESLKKNSSYSQLKTIIEEGLFINETINHLIYFFQQKIKLSQTSIEYHNTIGDLIKIGPNTSSDIFLYHPQNTDTYEKQFVKNVGMLPILEYLDTGLVTDPDKPTKFICLMCIRQEPEKCSETKKTLDFANKIKST